jgi:hypothetical protein
MIPVASAQRREEGLLGRNCPGQLAGDLRFDGGADEVDYVDYH